MLPWCACASAPSRPHLYAIVRTVDKTYSQSQSQNVTTESNKNSVQQRCTSLVDSQQPTPNYRADFLDHCQRRELNSNHQSARSQLLRSQRKKQKTNSLKSSCLRLSCLTGKLSRIAKLPSVPCPFTGVLKVAKSLAGIS